MLRPDFTPSFARDKKRCAKKHRDMALLDAAMRAVAFSDEEPLPERYKSHGLLGNWGGYLELHVDGRQGDWLLIYQLDGDTVRFVRTGSHDDLFK